jgi:hypothetical protein
VRDRTSVLPSAGRATSCNLRRNDIRSIGSCQYINKGIIRGFCRLTARYKGNQKAKLIKYEFHFVTVLQFRNCHSQVVMEETHG